MLREEILKKIEFKNISFHYPRNKKKIILDNLNLSIKKNSKIAIIGLSGAGKSTFIDIVAGLIEPNKGYIFIDSQKRKLIDISWKKNINYISQSSSIFDDTIKNNITFEKSYLIKKINI